MRPILLVSNHSADNLVMPQRFLAAYRSRPRKRSSGPDALSGSLRSTVIVFLLVTLLQVGMRESARAQTAWDDFQEKQYATDVQIQLKRLGCYIGKIDGDWKGLSKTALGIFNEQSKGDPAFSAASYLSQDAFLAALTKTRAGYCEVKTNPTTGRTCVRADVGKSFLGKLPPQLQQARQLADLLNFVHKNYDAIFTERGVPLQEVVDTEAQGRLADFGSRVASRDSTRKALELAKRRLVSLTFKYGSKDGGPCHVCVMVNDWKFLANFAQNTGGSLFHSQSPAGRINVADLTTALMHQLKDNIVVYRRMTEKWLQIVDGDGETWIDDDNGERKSVDRDDLEKKRRDEMDSLIRYADDLQTGKKKFPLNIARLLPGGLQPTQLLSEVSNLYNCVGFDGSAVD
jgi:hypothetical protein